jgi:hypothetical protein
MVGFDFENVSEHAEIVAIDIVIGIGVESMNVTRVMGQ